MSQQVTILTSKFVAYYKAKYSLTLRATCVEPIYGFDMPTFLNEIMRLRLSNQNFDVTVHYISDTSEEMSLSLGLAACLANSSDTASVNVLSGDCLWRFVRHQEKRSYRGKGRVTKQDLHLSKRQTLVNLLYMVFTLLIFYIVECLHTIYRHRQTHAASKEQRPC